MKNKSVTIYNVCTLASRRVNVNSCEVASKSSFWHLYCFYTWAGVLSVGKQIIEGNYKVNTATVR